MKLVKNFALAALLASVLAVSTPAGEIGTPAAVGPNASPTPQGVTSSDETKNAFYGDTETDVISAETSDYLFFEALAALLSVY